MFSCPKCRDRLVQLGILFCNHLRPYGWFCGETVTSRKGSILVFWCFSCRRVACMERADFPRTQRAEPLVRECPSCQAGSLLGRATSRRCCCGGGVSQLARLDFLSFLQDSFISLLISSFTFTAAPLLCGSQPSQEAPLWDCPSDQSLQGPPCCRCCSPPVSVLQPPSGHLMLGWLFLEVILSVLLFSLLCPPPLLMRWNPHDINESF